MTLSNKTKRNGMILLIGPTRSGKSCFINTITGKNAVEVGDDAGDSTTKTSLTVESRIDGFPDKKPFILIDTMGLDDSEEAQFGDYMIIANTTLFTRDLMENKKFDLDAILLFESLTNDSNQLQKSIKKLKAVYDDKITEKIIVILNKNVNPHQRRMEKLMKIISYEKLNFIHWKSNCGLNPLHDSYYDQINTLYELISRTAMSQKEINDYIDLLRDEGRIIYKNKSDESIKKLKYFSTLGAAGLMAFQILNLPSFIISNIAVWSTSEIMGYLINNDNFLISLAIEERISKKFNNKDEL